MSDLIPKRPRPWGVRGAGRRCAAPAGSEDQVWVRWVCSWLERVAPQVRSRLRQGSARVRAGRAAIVQTMAAATVAWWLAGILLPEPRPVFAPLAAIVALGATRGERGQRALQVSLGVVVGITAAELIVRLLGTGTWQLALVTGVALVIAVFFFEASTFVIQAGVSAALVVTVGASPKVVGVDRLLEAVVGSGVALLVSQVLFPPDAVADVREAVGVVLARVADGLDRLALVVKQGSEDDRHGARAAVRRANLQIIGLQDQLHVARQAVRLSRRRRQRGTGDLRRFDGVDDQLRATLSTMETLVGTADGLGEKSKDRLVAALEELTELARELAADIDHNPEELLGHAHQATTHVLAAHETDPGSAMLTVVELTRAIASGLLQIGGVNADAAERALADAQVS